MPRDSAGNYNLVSGNPVQSGEVISSSWANNTMDDLAVALTDSLDRNGRGGMLAPFRFADGTNLLPGAAWVNETTTGFYRFDGGDLRISVLTQDVMRWQTTGVQIWNSGDTIWENVLTDGGSGAQVPVNVGTADGQTLRWEADNSAWEASSALVVDDVGNVGIGTDSPTERLTVAYAGNVDGDSAAVVIGADGAGASSRQGMIRKNNITNVLRPLEIHASVQTTNQEITFHSSINTERMRIDSAGNVGIGNDSPSTKLHVVSSVGTPAVPNANATVALESSGNGGVNIISNETGAPAIYFGKPSVTTNGAIVYTNTDDAMAFRVAGNNEKMRIDSTGNVGIGTDTPVTKLEVIGTARMGRNTTQNFAFSGDSAANFMTIIGGSKPLVIDNIGADGGMQFRNAAQPYTWSQDGTERMRIDSAGNVLVGSTSTFGVGGKVQVQGGSTTVPAILAYTGVGSDQAAPGLAVVKASPTTTATAKFINFYTGSSVANGAVVGGGAGAAAFGTTSDIALKENVVELGSELANILALRPVEFDYKDGGGHQVGFIAQEMEQVYPESVDGEEGSKSIAGWGRDMARLVKAIQELTARLEVLENG